MISLLPHIAGKKHVIWDWNGTLLSDLEHVVQITNRLLAEEKLPAITMEKYKELFGFPVIDYYKKVGFNVTRERFLELCERFNQEFVDGLHVCDLWPGARETLAEIKNTGKVQSVLSATEQNLLNQQVKHFKIDHLFDFVHGIADKAATSKVGRGHELMANAKVSPAETVMIGDTDHDVEVGKALGIDVILVEHGHQHVERLRKIHHTVLKLI